MNIIELPKSRREAKKVGSRYYITGKACKNDHVTERQTNNGTCVQCNRGYANAHYSRNSAARIELVGGYRKNNAERVKRWAKKSYQNAKPAYLARVRKRELAKINRTPPWISIEQLREIATFYKNRDRKQAETGDAYHVDHIIPLQGSNISGLHVPWNLRIIPAYENLSKGNKLLSEVA